MKIRIDGSVLSKRLGVYRATITGRRIGTSRRGQNPVMSIEFTLNSQGPNPESRTVGKCVYDNITFTEDSIWKANTLYSAVTGRDIPEGDYTPDELFALLWNVCQGKEVIITVADETYEGITRPRVTSIQRTA